VDYSGPVPGLLRRETARIMGWLLAWPATAAVAAMEWWIRRRGQPLTASQQALAQALGVRSPERVRVLAWKRIPTPLPIAGMALGHGILLRADCCDNLDLLRHELVHVAQYERLGGRRRFLSGYFRGCMAHGYHGCALEVEARHLGVPPAAHSSGGFSSADH
jgi:hypothetical protein